MQQRSVKALELIARGKPRDDPFEKPYSPKKMKARVVRKKD